MSSSEGKSRGPLAPGEPPAGWTRRRLWPLAAVCVLVTLCLGGAYWWRSRPDPFRVLVAIDVGGQWWEGSRPASALADEICEGLSKIGFEPVRAGDPEVARILSTSKSP